MPLCKQHHHLQYRIYTQRNTYPRLGLHLHDVVGASIHVEGEGESGDGHGEDVGCTQGLSAVVFDAHDNLWYPVAKHGKHQYVHVPAYRYGGGEFCTYIRGGGGLCVNYHNTVCTHTTTAHTTTTHILDELKHEQHATQQHPIKACIQHAELTLCCPGVCVGATGPPHGQQVAHLKNCKYYKLEKCNGGIGIE